MSSSPPQVEAHAGTLNVATRLSRMAAVMPEATAVVAPAGRRTARYTFRQLDHDSDRLARGLRAMGVAPGTRLALMVPPSFDFIALVFALFKTGAVQVLIDPGMGRRNLLKCLDEAEPQGFIGIPLVQAARTLLGRRYPRARFNVTVGRRWFWRGPTLDELRGGAWTPVEAAPTTAEDPAAIIFTTGSTGPPKGVLYRHGNFDAQVDELGGFYQIEPGEIDVACFPLFALFNAALGVTTVIPLMDPTRPARVDPRRIIEAIQAEQATQAFGSPAVWNRVGRYCQERAIRLGSLRRVLSAGAPVPAHVLKRMQASIDPEGDVHTPYGATEALPVASISAKEVLGETQAKTDQGGGVCVGRKFPGIAWRIVRIVDGPIPSMADAEELPAGEIGELVVRGAVVTREYLRAEANVLGKIADEAIVWHRMGDVGYVDAAGRFWFCGRLAHRVVTPDRTLFTIPCEAVFNVHPDIFRSALVGIGPRGRQRPVILIEPWPEKRPRTPAARRKLLAEARQLGQQHAHTAAIEDCLLHPGFPVDIRHNAKIFREKLALWAARRLRA